MIEHRHHSDSPGVTKLVAIDYARAPQDTRGTFYRSENRRLLTLSFSHIPQTHLD